MANTYLLLCFCAPCKITEAVWKTVANCEVSVLIYFCFSIVNAPEKENIDLDYFSVI